MTQSPTLSTPIVKPNTFEFNCHINFDPTRIDVGFDVTWLFDGHPDTNLAPSHITGPTRDVSLDQKYLMGHLGKEVCSLSILFRLDKIPICIDCLHDYMGMYNVNGHTLNKENNVRILFSQITLKDLVVILKVRD